MLNQEAHFTSTGLKFFAHPEKIKAYQEGNGRTVISTHISPEGRCDLNCSYCSVRDRDKAERIDLAVIKDFVTKLLPRGLKAVILTGGGEPTLYPEINELINFLRAREIRLGMITNGMGRERVKHWEYFDWVRISVNMFDGWLTRLGFPVDRGDCLLGLSYIHAGGDPGVIYKLSRLADKLNAGYVRITVDCRSTEMDKLHSEVAQAVRTSGDARFFHQNKHGRKPKSEVCHQSYFRPYLSEVGGGTLFPCGSLVLNGDMAAFGPKFALCKGADVLDFLDGKIKPAFVPARDCDSCVFASTVEMLGTLKEGLRHADFV